MNLIPYFLILKHDSKTRMIVHLSNVRNLFLAFLSLHIYVGDGLNLIVLKG
jgi:hypothetical protein